LTYFGQAYRMLRMYDTRVHKMLKPAIPCEPQMKTD